MAPTDGHRRRRGSGTRVLTAGAAASLAISVAPVYSPSFTTVEPIAAVRLAVRQPSARRAARRRYRSAIARALAALRTAQAVATETFREHFTVVRRSIALMGSRKSVSREARQVLDREELRVRLAYDSAIAMAHHAYVTEMEAARLAFLAEVGSSPELIASQRYRATVHEVTSEYQLAVSAARARHRLSQSDEFAANRDRWLDGNSKRAAPHGARLRDALIAARQAYTSKLSVARAEFLRFA